MEQVSIAVRVQNHAGGGFVVWGFLALVRSRTTIMEMAGRG